MKSLRDLNNRLMEDAAFREEYARADQEYALVAQLIRARTEAKLTQAEVAERLGTTQSGIARLEGGRVSPTIATRRRYAEATGTRRPLGCNPSGALTDSVPTIGRTRRLPDFGCRLR